MQITIVVVPRESFSLTQVSLESIYQNTTFPFKLVYVDGGSPKHIRDYLATQAQEKDFELIRVDHFLSPNTSRNIGLKRVTTPYVVFVDNDVIVSPHWLEKLFNCAEQNKATIVGPLTCQYEPIHEEIHFAGGEARVVTDIRGRNHLREKMYKQGQKVEQLLPKFQQMETELCEFHCMLVRTSIFSQVGYLDEQMLNTKEHLDFCMTVRKYGGTVYFEPESIITYVPTVNFNWFDIAFYTLRWSDEWELRSLNRLRQKWDLADNMYFQHKYKSLGWRRRQAILQPLIDKLTFKMVNKNRFLNKVLMYGFFAPIDKIINRFVTTRYSQKYLHPQSQSDSRLVAAK